MRILFVGLMLVMGASSARAQLIVDYRGHMWEADGIGVTNLTAVGLVQTLSTPLTATPGMNEYTWVLEATTTDTPPSSMVTPAHITLTGRFSIYEDPSYNADYGVNPPNATSPATFQDGTLYLSGTFATLTLWWDPSAGMGNYQGVIMFDSGSHLAETDPSIYQGWTFGGTTSSVMASIPAGYDQAWDGQIFLAPLPVEEATWGGVKALYSSR